MGMNFACLRDKKSYVWSTLSGQNCGGMGWQGFQIMQGLVARVKNYILFKVRDCLLYSSSSSVTGRNPQNALAWRVFVTLRHWPLYWTVPPVCRICLDPSLSLPADWATGFVSSRVGAHGRRVGVAAEPYSRL